ncbi:MAG: hypothetical protein INH41_27420 [Myxococcaceae bacterium]|nr:hypothetical protein [Myxococcaceae bacterium]MCA3016130.1 hypothetical protein [Myxococcaceae bacterium]
MRAPVLAALVVWCGCATSGSTRFTSADDLKKLSSRPRPQQVFDRAPVQVDAWTLEGPLPDAYEEAPHEATSLFSKTLLDGAAARALRPSDAYACVARQTARFLVKKGGFPARPVRAFIEARCGVPTHGVQLNSFGGKAPASVTDEALLAQWKADVARLVAALPTGARAGVGFVREDGEAMVVLASQSPDVTLEPTPMVPGADGFVWVRGVTSRRADRVSGTANQGRSGTADCVNTEARAAPAFELKCPVSKADEAAWLSLSAHEKGRVLGFELVRLVVRPSGRAASTYTAPTLVEATPGSTSADFAAQLNAVRATLGLGALALSEPQSRDLAELTPFFFDATRRDDDAEEDRIALGVMAGWRVEQEIMHGTFGATAVEVPATAALLAELLESPGYRRDLLSPRAGVLAVGLFGEGGVLGAVVSTYELVQAPTWPATADRVLTALNGQRARNGKAPVQWVLLPSSVEQVISEAVARRSYDSTEALERFMEQAVSVTKRPVRGWRIETFDLDDVQWPAEVLSRDGLEVLFLVTTERAGKDPWGRYVLLLVILGGAAQPET